MDGEIGLGRGVSKYMMSGYTWEGRCSIDYPRDLCVYWSNSENISNSRYTTLYFITYGWEYPCEVIA